MKCHRLLYFVLFALSVVLCGSFIFGTNDTYALQDLTYTTTYNGSSFPQIGNFCNNSNNDPVSCDGYKYLIIEHSNISNNFGDNSQLSFTISGLSIYFPARFSLVIYDITNSQAYDLSTMRIGFFGMSSSSANTGEILKFTLTENYQSGIIPSGSLSITENGTYDVTNYAEAVVEIPEEDCPEGSGGGDYSNVLGEIKIAIYRCGAVLLVIYFFYCIYRMIIKTTGGV